MKALRELTDHGPSDLATESGEDDELMVRAAITKDSCISSLYVLGLELDLIIVEELTGVHDLPAGHLLELALADEVVQDLGLRVLALELGLLGVELLLQLPDVLVLARVRLMLEVGLLPLLLHLSLGPAPLGAKLE